MRYNENGTAGIARLPLRTRPPTVPDDRPRTPHLFLPCTTNEVEQVCAFANYHLNSRGLTPVRDKPTVCNSLKARENRAYGLTTRRRVPVNASYSTRSGATTPKV